MLTILTFVLGAQAVFAATTPFTNPLKRQTLTPTADCESACTPLENAISAADTTFVGLCTSAIVNGYAQCYDCLVSEGAVTQTSAQEVVDDYVANCKAEGVSVNGATVSGSSGGSSGTSTTQRGAASGTASAGSSTSTTTAPGSSSGGSSSGSSSGSSGGSSSSSSGNSGSSSGDADSDDDDSRGSSGSGLGSGNGFKSNGGMQLSAGYLVVSVAFAFSAVLLQS